jgi:hypothetical protein
LPGNWCGADGVSVEQRNIDSCLGPIRGTCTPYNTIRCRPGQFCVSTGNGRDYCTD